MSHNILVPLVRNIRTLDGVGDGKHIEDYNTSRWIGTNQYELLKMIYSLAVATVHPSQLDVK